MSADVRMATKPGEEETQMDEYYVNTVPQDVKSMRLDSSYQTREHIPFQTPKATARNHPTKMD
eukprot:6128676-Amphidinium_carterae.1